ncbi:MAG: hypothetical protein PVJ67_04130 [Candidatus Pacearchaeota archaeon]|jgi:hypothetical protein
MIRIWKCPRCGKETSGSYSYGGCRMAICWDCQDEDNKELVKRDNPKYEKELIERIRKEQ